MVWVSETSIAQLDCTPKRICRWKFGSAEMQDGDIRGSNMEREMSNFRATYRMEVGILDRRNISGKAISTHLEWKDSIRGSDPTYSSVTM